MKPYQIVVDVTLALLFGLIAVPLEIQYGQATATYENLVLSSVLVAVIMSAALAVRRWSPGLSLAVAWAGALVQMGFDRAPGPVDLAIFAVLYATAAYGSRVIFWAGFASSFVGATVITFYVMFGRHSGSAGITWTTIPIVVAMLVASGFALLLAWTVGALVRTALRAAENRRAQAEAEAGAAVEQERTRIARDMHDVVAHSLAVVIAQADGARYAAASDPAVATTALATISTTARAALADVRLLLTQLRHSQLEGPQPTLADLEELYAQVRAAGVTLRVDVDPAPRTEPPAAVQIAVYRILQEALTNALRHGDSSPVDVQLSWLADRVDFAVRNRVASAAAPAGVGGHGLIGMRERAQLVGGHVDVDANDGEFVVRGTIPLRGDA